MRKIYLLKPIFLGISASLIVLLLSNYVQAQSMMVFRPGTGTGGTTYGSAAVTPATAYDFLSSPVNVAVGPLNFVVRNTSSATATLNLTGSAPNYITVSGANASDFVISLQPSTGTIPINTSIPITITFTPSGAGVRTAQISIANDGSNNPYIVNLTGTGTAPNINLTQGSSYASGSTYSFGSTVINASIGPT
ncbi:MAG TPA: hypothetical protein VNW06_05615, partial [Cytophagaceae bacterium]|nr:hypothetical protein [Cytophagaceae bacterium]